MGPQVHRKVRVCFNGQGDKDHNKAGILDGVFSTELLTGIVEGVWAMRTRDCPFASGCMLAASKVPRQVLLSDVVFQTSWGWFIRSS